MYSNEDIFGFGQQALPPAVVIPVEVKEIPSDKPWRHKPTAKPVDSFSVNKKQVLTSLSSLLAGFSVLFVGSLLIASQADELKELRANSLATAGQSVVLLSGLASLGCFLRGKDDGES